MSNAIDSFRNETITNFIEPYEDHIERTNEIANKVLLEKIGLIGLLLVLTVIANWNLVVEFLSSFLSDFEFSFDPSKLLTLGAALGFDVTTVTIKRDDFVQLYKFKFRAMTDLRLTINMFRTLPPELTPLFQPPDNIEIQRQRMIMLKIRKFYSVTKLVTTIRPYDLSEFTKIANEIHNRCVSIVKMNVNDPNFITLLDQI